MEKIPRQKQTDLLKIVFFGPESTGKSTLAKQLAEHYNTNWVPEFARGYLQKKWDEHQEICELEDLVPIAIGQINSENELSKTANKVIFSDTDIFETKVYSEVYYGQVADELSKAVELVNYDLYFLTYIDTPWVADDLRDKPNEREKMFQHFKNALIARGVKYILLKGNMQTRFNKAVEILDELLKKSFKR